MAVYVDELIRWPHARDACFRAGSCHLTADTPEELHAFALRLELKRAWFQEHQIMDHYDLTVGRRAKAIALGAVEKPWREAARERRAKARSITG